MLDKISVPTISLTKFNYEPTLDSDCQEEHSLMMILAVGGGWVNYVGHISNTRTKRATSSQSYVILSQQPIIAGALFLATRSPLDSVSSSRPPSLKAQAQVSDQSNERAHPCQWQGGRVRELRRLGNRDAWDAWTFDLETTTGPGELPNRG